MEQSRKSLIRRASSSFKHNASFVARLPTIRRHKSQSLHSPAGNSKPPTATARGRGIRTMAEMNASAENLGITYVFIHPKFVDLCSDQLKRVCTPFKHIADACDQCF